MDIVDDLKWSALHISYVTKGLIFVRCLAREHEFVDTPWISLRDLPACLQQVKIAQRTLLGSGSIISSGNAFCSSASLL